MWIVNILTSRPSMSANRVWPIWPCGAWSFGLTSETGTRTLTGTSAKTTRVRAALRWTYAANHSAASANGPTGATEWYGAERAANKSWVSARAVSVHVESRPSEATLRPSDVSAIILGDDVTTPARYCDVSEAIVDLNASTSLTSKTGLSRLPAMSCKLMMVPSL